MKLKFIVILIIITSILSSCNEDRKKYHIGVSQCSDDEWRHQMNGEILRETFMYGNVDLEFKTAKDNNEKQIQDIKYFINKGVDLIIVAPNESIALTPIIERAMDRGIPVLVVDRKINSHKYTAFIGANNYEIGKAVGNYVLTKYTKGSNVIELTGLSNSSPAKERHEGFISALNNNFNLLSSEDAGWLMKNAQQKMDSLLSVYKDIDIVFAQNDRMALGAYNAAKLRGREKEIKFIGIDALPGNNFGLELVQEGILAASFIYPTGGDKVLQSAMQILNKKHFDAETQLNTAVVDSTNVIGMTLQTAQISELDRKVETLNGKVITYISRYYTQKLVLYGSLIILLLVAVLLIVTYKTLSVKSRLNRKLSEQKNQMEHQYEQLVTLTKQLEEATQAKLIFFTNISHDFRTPLTLVVDPIEQLLKSSSIGKSDRKLLELIKRNTNILMRLVNQILDFRKYESGKMEFSPECVNIKSNITQWNEFFSSIIVKKHVHFSFEAVPIFDYKTKADIEKLERIYFNLLSNAFKFTPENGKVKVRLSETEAEEKNSICIEVSNSGSLILPEHRNKIFDRFYKVDLHHSGSGIGLALVKAFVDLHGGTININSNHKEGTTVIVKIPKVECELDIISENITTNNTEIIIEESEIKYSENEDADDIVLNAENNNRLLIIDDNADIRSYIASIFNDKYLIIEAVDGIDGIKKAVKYVPDLIICDVMMPGIEGIECCSRLKSEVQTCHIPIILLTACSLDEQRIKGYDCGADSYISKPFNHQILLSRVDNLIESRSKLKQIFGDGNSIIKEEICDIDKDFVTRFKLLIEASLNNSELNVEDLGKEMGMSRVQLYRKLKSLTNYSPNEFLRITRLKKASTLLLKGEMSVSEIAYEVGFTSPSYFTKCYKDYFGENPTEAIRKY